MASYSIAFPKTGIDTVDRILNLLSGKLNAWFALGTNRINTVPVSGPTAPNDGQALVYDAGTNELVFEDISGAVPLATNTVQGKTKLSVAAVTATNPIAVGDNDPRNTDARTPTGAAGGDLGGTYPNPTVTAIHLAVPLAVTSGGTGVSSLTAHGVVLGEGTSNVAVTAAMTDGQLLVGQTGADPRPKTMSSDATLAASGALTLKNTGTAGTYADASHVPVLTTDAQGRVTAVTPTAIQIAESQVTNLTTDLAAKVPTSRQVIAGTNLSGGGALTADVTLNLASPLTTDINLGSHKLTNVTDPSSAQDAATKAYVDSVAIGLDFKEAARLATTTALPANVYLNGASGVGATLTGVSFGALSIDGVTPSVGDRILVKNEATQANNGIYVVTTVGAIATLYVLTRSADFNQSSEIGYGDTVPISAGTTLTGTLWLQTTTGTITVGTTAIVFIQISGTAVPSGSAGGDLGGTYPNPTVLKQTTLIAKTQSVTVTGVSYQIPSSTPVVYLSTVPSGTTTLTSNPPIITSGAVDGQILYVICTDASSGGTVVVPATGSNGVGMPGGPNSFSLSLGGSMIFVYNSTLSLWIAKEAFGSAQAVPTKVGGTAIDTSFSTGVATVSSGVWTIGSTLPGSLVLQGDLDLGTHRIHNVVDPSSAQDAATKNYVDNAISGLSAAVSAADAHASAASAAATSADAHAALASIAASVADAHANTASAAATSADAHAAAASAAVSVLSIAVSVAVAQLSNNISSVSAAVTSVDAHVNTVSNAVSVLSLAVSVADAHASAASAAATSADAHAAAASIAASVADAHAQTASAAASAADAHASTASLAASAADAHASIASAAATSADAHAANASAAVSVLSLAVSAADAHASTASAAATSADGHAAAASAAATSVDTRLNVVSNQVSVISQQVSVISQQVSLISAGIGLPQMRVVQSDDSMSATGAFNNISGMSLSVTSAAWYKIEGRMLFNLSVPTGTAFGFTYPAAVGPGSMTMEVATNNITGSPVNLTSANFAYSKMDQTGMSTAATAQLSIVGVSAITYELEIYGLIHTSTTAGTLQLQSKSSAATGLGPVILAGSYLQAFRIK